MVSHPKTPILNCFYHLLWFYVLTVSEFSCLAKSYSGSHAGESSETHTDICSTLRGMVNSVRKGRTPRFWTSQGS